MSLVDSLPSVLILGMGGSFMRRLRLSSVVTALSRVVGGSLYYLIQLDVKLSSGQNLAHPSDIVLHEMFVQGVRDWQFADVCECRHPYHSWGP